MPNEAPRTFHKAPEPKLPVNKKKGRHWKIWTIFILTFIFAVIWLTCQVIIMVGNWFDKNKIVGHQVIKIEINPPFTIEKRSAPQGAVKKVKATPTPEQKLINMAVPKAEASYTGRKIIGKVSHYSKAGCLGCDPNFIMANGEQLDDNRPTIAVVPGALPMNTKVLVKNLDNGKSIEAVVTDTGGFAKYNRVADLTLAVANAIGSKTDVSTIEITEL